jgi:hypothetical protein
MTHMDAHHAEYAAAVAGMQDTYGTPTITLPAVGDFVSGLTAGRRWSGHVEWIEGDRLTIDVGGAWLAVPAKDITH